MRYLTRVEVLYVENRANRWLRFAQPLKERILDDSCRHVFFTPESRFGLIDWKANAYGTTAWRVDILRCVNANERASQIKGVSPGAEILLRASGEQKVKQVLLLVDLIEAAGFSPTLVSRDYWRCVHNRLSVNEPPPVLRAETHEAFRRRREPTP